MSKEQGAKEDLYMEDFAENALLSAVRGLLEGRVNELLGEVGFAIPPIEFGGHCPAGVCCPVVSLSACERTEKERVVRLDAYALSVSFSVEDLHEGELFCFAYASAFEKALYEDRTLGGVADRVEITGKKYRAPQSAHGGGWELVLALRVSVEQIASNS